MKNPALNFTFLLLALFFLGASSVFAQKILQIEKYGNPKARKYFIGDEITYQLKGEKDWFTETIEDIILSENAVLFTHHLVKIEDIGAIKTYKNRRWSKSLGQNLYLFGGSWVFFSLIGPLVDWPITKAIYIVPAIAVVTGWLIQKIFKSKTYKLGKKRKLRLLDLNMTPGFKNHL